MQSKENKILFQKATTIVYKSFCLKKKLTFLYLNICFVLK